MEAKKLEEISFGIVSQAGDSFSYSMEAIGLIRKNDFAKAEAKLKLAEDVLLEAHKTHSELLFDFAQGKGIETNILLVHAQDHLTKAELMVIFTRENMEMKKEILNLHQTI
ncbi:PTS system cellobiose-specific IIA component/PTS system lactose-specific IIA component [Entomoplasma freundtii]|uniref:PTS system lactose-specific EIIA component n=1 Tax=Entomoplasma freundtii TaxID=74700 RepID=A0A2K8NR51_9MOLU|nr:PTS lactose/cellobiose transporter subunit IIA [Entomoplasma freundtii]ATZ16312.1 PTS cellobiose transporter subunit IIA [Entomoplasma freundtii]TDY56786.1 PTS system cellobiose-specific IIA component/PTS system lactose-specific IIA component [Entomoplasma freundtii]